MKNFLNRTEILIGNSNTLKLKKLKVAIIGLGGVGTYALEALARCGVEKFILIDEDTINATNINRQILALENNIGESKVSVAKSRILSINSKANVECKKIFYTKKCKNLLANCDGVIDAIDTISSKLDLIKDCYELNIPIFSAMGTANKKDPTKFKLADIYSTSNCSVCKIMRKELRKRGIPKLDVVYSTETSNNFIEDKSKLGSIAYVPATAGLLLAYLLVNYVMNTQE